MPQRYFAEHLAPQLAFVSPACLEAFQTEWQAGGFALTVWAIPPPANRAVNTVAKRDQQRLELLQKVQRLRSHPAFRRLVVKHVAFYP